MSISYSGVVGYGKVTLPSVDNWGSNMNILKDPPKSVQTRKIDKVGDTSAITHELGNSGDRFCEAINYYPRGVNPMVSVSYDNNGSNAGNLGSITNGKGQAFLPYRIMRDGAFRPPIRGQEDLLPLSRMPRIWMTVKSQPYLPEFTRRIKNCGTCENTREVKKFILKKDCNSCKTFRLEPGANEPEVVGHISSILTPCSVEAFKSCPTGGVAEKMVVDTMKEVVLIQNHPTATGYTNKCADKKSPFVPKNISLKPNRPIFENASTNISSMARRAESQQPDKPLSLRSNRPVFENYQTNTKAMKETPIVAKNISLSSNRPQAVGITNISMPGMGSVQTDRIATLREKVRPASMGTVRAIPKTTTFVPNKNLVKVR